MIPIQVRVFLNEFHVCLLEHYEFLIGLSLEELGIRALERLPRDKAINGIHAFNELRYVFSLSIFRVPIFSNNDTIAMI